MRAIINSQYIVKNIENIILLHQNILLGFKSQEAKEKAMYQFDKNITYISYSSRDLQFPTNSGINTISIFENYDS